MVSRAPGTPTFEILSAPMYVSDDVIYIAMLKEIKAYWSISERKFVHLLSRRRVALTALSPFYMRSCNGSRLVSYQYCQPTASAFICFRETGGSSPQTHRLFAVAAPVFWNILQMDVHTLRGRCLFNWWKASCWFEILSVCECVNESV
jgi:hypothetical protein